MRFGKHFLLIFLLVSCATKDRSSDSTKNRKKLFNLNPQEIKRINYYKKLRLQKEKRKLQKYLKKIKMSSQEEIILEQHIQMACYRLRSSKSSCLRVKKSPPVDCLNLLKKKRFKKLETCFDKHLR